MSLMKEHRNSKGYYILQAKSFLFLKNGKFLAFDIFFSFHSDAPLLGKRVSSKKNNEM